MKGLILAAGSGTRLRPLTQNIPKPLVSVMGQPLIDYTIEAFIQAGFTELGVVGGYKGCLLQEFLGDGKRYGIKINYIHNKHYQLGNTTSILASQHFVNQEPFIVSMVDHMISPAILSCLFNKVECGNILCVDRQVQSTLHCKEATKVWIDERGFVLEIGKGLSRFNAIDTGVFLFTPRVFHHLSICLQNGPCSITRALRHMIAKGDTVISCDITGSFWFDVDTLDDLEYVCTVLQRRAQEAAVERDGNASSDLGSSEGERCSISSPTSVWNTPHPPPVAGSSNK
jgi:choline kinase